MACVEPPVMVRYAATSLKKEQPMATLRVP